MAPRVLIVDETWQIARLEAVVAGECGCTVDIATSGEAAVERLRGRDYDAVLVGSPVPVTDDRTVLDFLRGELRHVARQAIVVTTHTQHPHLLSVAASANVFAVVAKPFDVHVLEEVVSRCIASGGAAGSTLWVGMREPTRETA